MTNLHEMQQDSINRAVDGEQAVARDAESSAQWRWGRPKPIIQEQTNIPQTYRRTGATTARRDERKSRDGAHEACRERTARSAWCDKHKRKAPPDMLTGRSVQACLSREVPTDPEARGHRSSGCGKSEAAAAELSSGVESTQLWQECTPEAKTEHHHDRICAQALSERTGAGQRREREAGGNSVVLVSPRSHAQHVEERA